MPIFQGDEMIAVRTPDGRTLTLPRSAVPQGAQIVGGDVPPPVSDELLGAPGAVVPEADLPRSVTGGQIPNSAQQVVDEPPVQNGADYVVKAPKGLPGNTAEVKRANAKYDQQQKVAAKKKAAADKAAAARAASPQGQLESAQAQQTAGYQNEAAAIAGSADLQAAEDLVLADAYKTRNENVNQVIAKRDNDMRAQMEAQQAKYDEKMAMRKKIASTKIDRSLDHPVLVGLAAALAGIGQAMNQKAAGQMQNPDVTGIIMPIIERKVAAQMQDLDLMAKAYGMTKDELEELKEQGKSKLEMHSIMIAGEIDKATRQIEEITARSASEKTKANAKIMIAQLQQKAADKTMEATRWGLDFDQKAKFHKESIGVQYAGIAESKRHNLASEQLQREQIYADQMKALAADRARGDEAAMKMRMQSMKDVRENGIIGADNNYLLKPQGRAKMAEAAKLEAEAQQIEDKYKNDPMGSSIAGNKVNLMRQKAAELRGDAQTFDVVQVRDTAEAKAISKKYAAAQAMMDTVDEIKMLYDQAGRGYISKSRLQQELQAKVGLLSVAAKDAWELGAWDKGSAKLVADIIGQDPTNGWDTGAITSKIGVLVGNDPEGFKNRLDAVTVKLEQDVKQQIQKSGGGWDGKDALFTRKKAGDMNTPTDEMSANLTQAKTGVELQEQAEKVGTVGKAARAVGYPFSPNHKEEADNAQSPKYQGLSRDQEAPFEGLLGEYKKGNAKAGDELVAKVINTAKERPELATALLHNLREYAPNLYTAARAGLPKDSEADKQMTYEEQNRIGTAGAPARDIATMVINTLDENGLVKDEDGYKELARRAAKKDPEARQALMDIQKAAARKKDTNAVPPWAGGR